MKNSMYTLTLFIWCLFTASIQAQCEIENGTFDPHPDLTDFANAFNGWPPYSQYRVPGWVYSHGSPSIGFDNGNPYAWMWSRDHRGEGIISEYQFKAGINYTLSFRIRTNDGNDLQIRQFSTVNLIAVEDLYPNHNSSVPFNAQAQETIFTENIAPFLNNWETVTISFIPSRDYNGLWIFPNNTSPASPGSSQASMAIDDVTITQKTLNPIFGIGKLSCLGYNSYSINLSGQPNTGLHNWHVYHGNDINNPGAEVVSAGIFGTTDHNVTLTVPFDSGDSFIIKHGIWNDCQTWVESRQVITIPCPDTIDPSFTFKQLCKSDLTNTVVVTGSKNPCDTYQQYMLRDAATNQVLETLDWSTISPNHYASGSFEFSTLLENGKQYKIQHGVWSEDCIAWTHEIKTFTANCQPSDDCDFVLEEIVPRCWDRACDNWVGEFGFEGSCIEGINKVEFYTPGNCLGTYHTKITPQGFVIPVSPDTPGGSYVIEADIYLNNGDVLHRVKTWNPCLVGNKSNIEKKISISPNPAKPGELITIAIEQVEIAIEKMEVVNSRGESIKTPYTKVDGIHIEFRLSSLTTEGIYFIKMIDRTGETITKKLIVL